MDSEARDLLILVLFGVAALLMAWFPYHNARQRKHPYAEAIGAGCVLFALLCLGVRANPVLAALPTILWVGLIIWSYVTPPPKPAPRLPRGGSMYRDPIPPGFEPVTPPPPLAQPVQEEAGTFVIVGVDKATGDDVELKVFAATEANARAKAELKGVLVTRVDRAF